MAVALVEVAVLAPVLAQDMAGVVGMVLGDIPTAYGLHPLISITIGAAVMLGILYWGGSRVEDAAKPGGKTGDRKQGPDQ